MARDHERPLTRAADPRRGQALAVVGVTVAALHAAGLYGLARAPLAGRDGPPPRVVMHVALLSAPPEAPSLPVPVPSPAIGAAVHVAVTDEQPSPPRPVAASPHESPAAAVAFGPVPTVAAEPESFLRFRELSRPPRWLGADGESAPEPAELERGLPVTIYLDASGHVAALHADDETRLASAQALLAQALRSGGFQPAETDDLPVRSRMRALLLQGAGGVRVWLPDAVAAPSAANPSR